MFKKLIKIKIWPRSRLQKRYPEFILRNVVSWMICNIDDSYFRLDVPTGKPSVVAFRRNDNARPVLKYKGLFNMHDIESFLDEISLPTLVRDSLFFLSSRCQFSTEFSTSSLCVIYFSSFLLFSFFSWVTHFYLLDFVLQRFSWNTTTW